MLSVIGGKATTLRAMAEETTDLICRKFGLDLPCRTCSTPLLPYRSYYD
jgi:glycerol-3-phosphate dehydrogenase